MTKSLILAMCLLLVVSDRAGAQDDTSKKEAPRHHQQIAKIPEDFRQRLQDPVDLTLNDVKLSEAIKQLGEKAGVDFWINSAALQEEGLNSEQIKVSVNLRQVSSRGILKRILHPANLGWVCDETGVMITIRAEAINTYFPRVYDISDLLGDEETPVPKQPDEKAAFKRPAKQSNSLTSRPRMRSLVVQSVAQFGGLAGAQPKESAPSKEPTEGSKLSTDTPKDSPQDAAVRKLIEMINVCTGGPPDGPWLDSDGEGGSVRFISTSNARLLVIRQNEDTHAEIENLLNEILTHHHGIELQEEVAGEQVKTASK